MDGDRCWERLRAGGEGVTEDEMVGWHHWLNGHEFEQTLGDSEGQRSLVCCSPWGCKESDMTGLNWTELSNSEGFPGGTSANAGDVKDAASIPGSGKCSGEGNGNPLLYPCLESPMDRGAWWATVHGVTKSQTQPSNLAPAQHQWWWRRWDDDICWC